MHSVKLVGTVDDMDEKKGTVTLHVPGVLDCSASEWVVSIESVPKTTKRMIRRHALVMMDGQVTGSEGGAIVAIAQYFRVLR